jgi:hypothetical protein
MKAYGMLRIHTANEGAPPDQGLVHAAILDIDRGSRWSDPDGEAIPVYHETSKLFVSPDGVTYLLEIKTEDSVTEPQIAAYRVYVQTLATRLTEMCLPNIEVVRGYVVIEEE